MTGNAQVSGHYKRKSVSSQKQVYYNKKNNIYFNSTDQMHWLFGKTKEKSEKVSNIDGNSKCPVDQIFKKQASYSYEIVVKS